MDAHEAFLQAAGGEARRVAALLEGRDGSPLENELVALAEKSVWAPALLAPEDLAGLRRLVGHGAVDYALVACAFHFINRIADLLGVDLEVVPAPLRRFEALRQLIVSVGGRMLRGGVELDCRPDDTVYTDAVAAIAPLLGDDGRDAARVFEPVRERPRVVEVLRLAIEERDLRSTLPREALARIHRVVEDALPLRREDAEGLSPRPSDPIDAFAFVGTRHPARVTREMIDRLRGCGMDDLRVLDAAIAVADANQWARLHRLLGLPSRLFHLPASV